MPCHHKVKNLTIPSPPLPFVTVVYPDALAPCSYSVRRQPAPAARSFTAPRSPPVLLPCPPASPLNPDLQFPDPRCSEVHQVTHLRCVELDGGKGRGGGVEMWITAPPNLACRLHLLEPTRSTTGQGTPSPRCSELHQVAHLRCVELDGGEGKRSREVDPWSYQPSLSPPPTRAHPICHGTRTQCYCYCIRGHTRRDV